MQVIASLAYLVYLIDGYQQYWLRLLWGFDSEMSFYYICGKLRLTLVVSSNANAILFFANYFDSIALSSISLFQSQKDIGFG